MQIDYEDSKGDLTVRVIKVLNYNDTTGKIYAWCEFRNAYRSFIANRIICATDTETGEFIDDIDEYLYDRMV